MENNSVSPKPILLSALIGAAIGAIVGAMVAYRRAQGGATRIDARAAVGAGVTGFTLAKQLVEMFSS